MWWFQGDPEEVGGARGMGGRSDAKWRSSKSRSEEESEG